MSGAIPSKKIFFVVWSLNGRTWGPDTIRFGPTNLIQTNADRPEFGFGDPHGEKHGRVFWVETLPEKSQGLFRQNFEPDLKRNRINRDRAENRNFLIRELSGRLFSIDRESVLDGIAPMTE